MKSNECFGYDKSVLSEKITILKNVINIVFLESI